MENTFKLTDEHTIMLDGMNDELKDTAKQISGFSILDLESLIEQAEQFDRMFNTDNWQEDDFPYDYYSE